MSALEDIFYWQFDVVMDDDFVFEGDRPFGEEDLAGEEEGLVGSIAIDHTADFIVIGGDDFVSVADAAREVGVLLKFRMEEGIGEQGVDGLWAWRIDAVEGFWVDIAYGPAPIVFFDNLCGSHIGSCIDNWVAFGLADDFVEFGLARDAEDLAEFFVNGGQLAIIADEEDGGISEALVAELEELFSDH